jgi:hypothetical protein
MDNYLDTLKIQNDITILEKKHNTTYIIKELQ